MRLRYVPLPSMEMESIEHYIELFDIILQSVGWDESKLLSEIDKNWDSVPSIRGAKYRHEVC
jgi:hypothetical protein